LIKVITPRRWEYPCLLDGALDKVFPRLWPAGMATLLFPAAGLPQKAATPTCNQTTGIREIAMGLQQPRIESLPFVTAELDYLAPTAGKPRTYAFDPPPGEPKTTALPESHQVLVFDARLIAGGISLDREGFALVRHPTIVRNFYDDKEVRNVYYPAAEAFLKATLKADRVFIFRSHRAQAGRRCCGRARRRPAATRNARACRSDRNIGTEPRARASARGGGRTPERTGRSSICGGRSGAR